MLMCLKFKGRQSSKFSPNIQIITAKICIQQSLPPLTISKYQPIIYKILHTHS